MVSGHTCALTRLNINLVTAAAAQADLEEAESGTQGTSVDCMKLSFEKELNLNLYRHWTVYDSLCHTLYTASKFKIWTLKGKQRLSEFLAELGLPLVQCKQKFSTMDLELRSNIVSLFEEKVEKWGLDDITYGSYVANYGFRNKFCAADVAYACMAVMEQHLETSSSGLVTNSIIFETISVKGGSSMTLYKKQKLSY